METTFDVRPVSSSLSLGHLWRKKNVKPAWEAQDCQDISSQSTFVSYVKVMKSTCHHECLAGSGARYCTAAFLDAPTCTCYMYNINLEHPREVTTRLYPTVEGGGSVRQQSSMCYIRTDCAQNAPAATTAAASKVNRWLAFAEQLWYAHSMRTWISAPPKVSAVGGRGMRIMNHVHVHNPVSSAAVVRPHLRC